MPRRVDSTSPALRNWVKWWLAVDSLIPIAEANSPLLYSPVGEQNSRDRKSVV